MGDETWHSDFVPSKFLSRVDLSQLIKRNESYNGSSVSNVRALCILCAETKPRGLLLNDRSYLCAQCYEEVALISYPEKYEDQRRQFLVAKEARRLAWNAFREKFGRTEQRSMFVLFGIMSFVLTIFVQMPWIIGACLLVVGLIRNSKFRKEFDEWTLRKQQWEECFPEPIEPTPKHFHDPTAELSQRDQKVLKIFNHWPGYPPFWKYLRSVVLSRDSNRCQVTGCPSRLELHVHHKRPVSEGGAHSPDNLVSLCDFHHALEPEKGHERIWGEIKTRYFTLVCAHERANRSGDSTFEVKAHLRRLQLVSIQDLRALQDTYRYCCPSCRGTNVKISLISNKNLIRVECTSCRQATEGPQELAEETGPRLAEILGVAQNQGTWKARWDMLSQRKNAIWGSWSGYAISAKRKRHREKLETTKSIPRCPKCGSAMRVVEPSSGDKWKAFWGCTLYGSTGCRGTAKYH